MESKNSDQTWEEQFAAAAPLVLASSQIIGTRRKVIKYAFRIEPSNQYDSGWNFWSGEETEEFRSNADNFAVCPLSAFLEMDPGLKEILESPTGSAWERGVTGSWRQVVKEK